MWYAFNLRGTDTGISPGFVEFEKLSDGTAPTNPSPSIIEVGTGIYKFEYIAAEDVVFAIDANANGATVPDADRWVRGVLSPIDDFTTSTRSAVFNATAANYDSSGTIGSAINTIRKVQTGRWKIEDYYLNIYDDDGVTVLIAYDLFDDAGSPTNSKVFERRVRT